MSTWLPLVLTPLAAVIASSGFWAWMMRRDQAKNAMTRLMMGMAYNHITTEGVKCIQNGWISKDQYEELRKYFYEPYRELGGNGVAERVMNEVTSLPFSSRNPVDEIIRNNQNEVYINNVRTVPHPEQQAHAE